MRDTLNTIIKFFCFFYHLFIKSSPGFPLVFPTKYICLFFKKCGRIQGVAIGEGGLYIGVPLYHQNESI